MKGTTKLFRIFGIDIQLHFSWWIIFFILAWSLSASFFPHYFSGYSTLTYWMMGVIAAFLLFLSVLLHELSHSLVAKWRNIKVESITLFFFGGVAGITKEDMKPSSEFLMAIAGPIFSLLLAGIFFIIYKLDGNSIITAITFYLYQLNFILALFNLLPGFPLDGGRAFRALLYAYYKDLKKATRIASGVGKFFAGFLIILGIFGLFSGVGPGLWFILIGGFLYFIAGISYDQVVLKEILGNVPVTELIGKIPTVNSEMKFKDFAKKYSKTEEHVFLVKGKNFLGVLDLDLVQKIPEKMQSLLKLKQISQSFSRMKSLSKNGNAYHAFKLIADRNLFLVMEKSKLVGVVTRRALMSRLQWELKFKDEHHKIRIKHHVRR